MGAAASDQPSQEAREICRASGLPEGYPYAIDGPIGELKKGVDVDAAIQTCSVAVRDSAEDPELRFALGTLLERKERFAEAATAYEQAAAANHPQALFAFAALLDLGQGVAEDAVRARELLRRAAALEEPRAMLVFGLFNHSGRGGARDDAAALSWYLKAADRGVARAYHNLGV